MLFLRSIKCKICAYFRDFYLWSPFMTLTLTFIRVLLIFGISDLGWPLLTSFSLFLKSWSRERHFDIQFTHFQWLLKFDLFSEFLTSGDLFWPRDPFFWKAYVKSVSLIYMLSYFIKVRNLTFFRNLWPLMTSDDLKTTFFGKLSSRASFWYINWPVYANFEIWPKNTRNL